MWSGSLRRGARTSAPGPLACPPFASVDLCPCSYTPYVGDIQTRENGSLVCHETGQVGSPAAGKGAD